MLILARSNLKVHSKGEFLLGVPLLVLLVLFLSLDFSPASAHTTVEVENLEIDVGWVM